jgi:hypothetical protein
VQCRTETEIYGPTGLPRLLEFMAADERCCLANLAPPTLYQRVGSLLVSIGSLLAPTPRTGGAGDSRNFGSRSGAGTGAAGEGGDTGSASGGSGGSGGAGRPPYAMVSYAWGVRAVDGTWPLQRKAQAIAAEIRAAGRDVCIDTDELARRGGSGTLRATCATMVARAAAVVACISDAYARSELCTLELLVAMDRGVPLYFAVVGDPAVTHPAYADGGCSTPDPHGWTPSCIDVADQRMRGSCALVLRACCKDRLWAACRTDAEMQGPAGLPKLLEAMSDGRNALASPEAPLRREDAPSSCLLA